MIETQRRTVKCQDLADVSGDVIIELIASLKQALQAVDAYVFTQPGAVAALCYWQ
jgi:hypothetical protein